MMRAEPHQASTRQGWTWPGTARRGSAPLFAAVQASARSGVTRHRSAGRGRAGRGAAWDGLVGQGEARLPSAPGMVRHGESRWVAARRGLAHIPGLGKAPQGLGPAVPCMARRGVGSAGYGEAPLTRHGWACQVKAWCGSTGLGLAPLGLGSAGRVMAGRGTARKGTARLVWHGAAPLYSGLVPAWRERRGGALLGLTRFGMARVLGLLGDGAWHSHLEGYRLGVMLHSRVADLRHDGHVIECRRNGEFYEYRLSLEQATVAPKPPAAVASSSERPLAETGVTKAAAEPHPVSASEQLVLSGGAFRRTAA